MFLGPPLPKTGQSGAADVAPVPGCHFTVLRSHTQLCHLPLPVVCLPKVGGGYCCSVLWLVWSVQVERNWALKRKAKWAERDGFPSPPAL